MTMNVKAPDIRELKPRITVFGVGGAGGNAVNNMISAGLEGVDFVVANTDAQALSSSKAERIVQMGVQVTEGLGAGSQPEVGRAAAEEVLDEIRDHLSGSHMVFVTAGMGGGTGTGAAPVIARTARETGILTVGVVTKPFQFEGGRRMKIAEAGIEELQKCVDTLIVIPNQNLFRIANERTTFADAFAMADQVLYSGVACITDLMVKEGLINLDFADVRSVMREMGKAMMGTGEASGENRAITAAEAAIANPLLDEVSMRGARGLLISITGGNDLTLYEVDEAATRIREEVDPEANIILGATFDKSLDGVIRVSVVATGIDVNPQHQAIAEARLAETLHRHKERILSKASITPPAAAPSQPATLHEPALASQHEALRPPPSAAPAPVEAPVAAPSHPHSDHAHGQAYAPAAPAMSQSAPVFAPRASASHPAMGHAHSAVMETRVGDVDLRPIAPRPSLFVDAITEIVSTQPQLKEPDVQETFVPPMPERVERAPVKSLSIEDFPMPVQEQIRARRAAPAEHTPEKKRMTLLQRLANVGFGKREEEPQATHDDPPAAQRPVIRPVIAEPSLISPTAPSDYARGGSHPVQPQHRPAPQGLDPLGRQQHSSLRNAFEEEQLDIPAFLRRQST